MILSDGEIQEAIKTKQIIIDPIPEAQQYTTSALDLYLGDELFQLKTVEELQEEEPEGVEREPIVDLSKKGTAP